jgi:hypothetical protein
VEFFKDASGLVIFIVLFMPGFVATQVFALLIPGERRDYAKTLYEVIGYSFLSYAVWSWLLIPIGLGWSPPLWMDGAVAFVVVLLTPVALPLLYLKLARSDFFTSKVLDPCPSSWDWAFSENKKAMVLVHLRDGRRVGGVWGGGAFASSYPVPNDLYLSEVWNVEQMSGKFLNAVKDTRGLVLWGTDIEMVEFFDLDATKEDANVRSKGST